MTQLPRSWIEARIPAIADVLDSRRVPVNKAERASRAGNVPYYGATGQVGWIDRALFREELCLLGEDGAPFLDRQKEKAYVVDGPSWINNHAHVLRAVLVATSNRFLKYVLDWIDYAPFVNGTTRLKLTQGALATIPIPFPPLNEQRRIVAAIEEQFSRLDAAQVSLEKAHARFTRFLDAVHVAALAADWPRVQLGALLREPLRNGHSAKASSNGEIRTLTLTAVTRGEFTERHTKMTAADPARVENLWLEPGDILIERSNTPELVGTAALYDGPRRWAIFPDLLIRVRVGDRIIPEFVKLVLEASPARRYFRAAAQGIAGTMPKIDQGAVERLSLPLPPLDEQERIVAEVDAQRSRVAAMAHAIEVAERRAAALRRAILEQAFRGELVPQDPSDEPASVLLERIVAERATAQAATGRRPRRRATMQSS